MSTDFPELPKRNLGSNEPQESLAPEGLMQNGNNPCKSIGMQDLVGEELDVPPQTFQDRRNSVAPSQRTLPLRRNHRRNHSADFALLGTSNAPEDAIDGMFPSFPQRQEQSTRDVQQQAQELLNNFAVQEFKRQGISPPDALSSGFTNAAWIRTGQDLRILAEAFSKSQERDIVRKRAQKVRMEAISLENFFSLCAELFKEGISQERIVVLFTFVSDIAIYHVLEGGQRFVRRLMDWSLRYICIRICTWVQANGGWAAVLSVSADIIYRCTMFLCAAFAITACGIYITKNLKNA